jgi:hypothetical protein
MTEPDRRIVFLSSDWGGLYVDGQLITEGHAWGSDEMGEALDHLLEVGMRIDGLSVTLDLRPVLEGSDAARWSRLPQDLEDVLHVFTDAAEREAR